MAILGVGPASRQVQRSRRALPSQAEATTWLPGVAVDPVAVRRAVLAELGRPSCWSQVRSLGTGWYRALRPVEAALWVDQLVGTAQDGDVARAHALGAALERRPFVVVVTPDALVLRWDRGVAGEREAQRLLKRLAGAASRRTAVAA